MSSFLITGMMKKQLAIECGEFLTTGYVSVLLYVLIKLHDHPPMPKDEHSQRMRMQITCHLVFLTVEGKSNIDPKARCME